MNAYNRLRPTFKKILHSPAKRKSTVGTSIITNIVLMFEVYGAIATVTIWDRNVGNN